MFNPVAFTVFGYPIRWYGIAMALALLVSTWLASALLKKRGREGELVWDGVIWAAIFGIVGARIIYVLTNWSNYADNPLSVFYVNQGGLSFHGGILGGILGCWLYFRNKKIRFIEIMDAAAPGVSIGIMLVRFLGNLSNGDISGYKVSQKIIPWALSFPQDEYHNFGQNPTEFIPRHPTEIYGGIVGLLLLIITLIVWFKKTTPGTNFYTFILGYSLIRSLIEEPFRNVPHYIIDFQNELYGFGGVTMTQLVSIFFIIVAIFGLVAVNKKGCPADWDKPISELVLGASQKEGLEAHGNARSKKPSRRIMTPKQEKKPASSSLDAKTPRKPFR